jgi:hypothetical protein
MIQAKNSWLCMSCGHLEPISPDSVPLVSKKQTTSKTISQDMSAPSAKAKAKEPKAVEKKTEVKPEVDSVIPPKSDPKPEVSTATPAELVTPQIETKTEVNTTNEEEKKVVSATTNVVSAAPSAAELHPLNPIVTPVATPMSPEKTDSVIPQTPTPVDEKNDVEAPTPVIETEPKLDAISPASLDAISPAQTSEPVISETSVLEESKPTTPVIETSEAEPEPKSVVEPTPQISEPVAVVEEPKVEPVIAAPTEPVSVPSAEPMPLPVAEAPTTPEPMPAEVAQNPLAPTEAATVAVSPLKTVAPETHPKPANIGLIIWISVGLISFIALVVFGYAFYKGIDLFAGLRK